MVALLLLCFLLLYLGYCADVDGIKEYTPAKSNKTIRRILGIILIVLGSLGCISSLILYMAQDIIQESIPYMNIDIDIAAGLYLFFIVWGNYIIKFVPSNVKKWQKITKGIGYLFLCIALYILCFIPSFVKDSEPIGLLVVMSLILLLISILLIRLSRKREGKILILKNNPDNENTKKEIVAPAEDKTNKKPLTETLDFFKRKKKCFFTFAQKVNITLWIIISISLITSIIFFISMLCESEESIAIWLISSFLCSLFLTIWAYLNYKELSNESYEKYGLSFIVGGFMTCVLPFSALALLIIGTIFCKKVFSDNIGCLSTKS